MMMNGSQSKRGEKPKGCCCCYSCSFLLSLEKLVWQQQRGRFLGLITIRTQHRHMGGLSSLCVVLLVHPDPGKNVTQTRQCAQLRAIEADDLTDTHPQRAYGKEKICLCCSTLLLLPLSRELCECGADIKIRAGGIWETPQPRELRLSGIIWGLAISPLSPLMKKLDED